MTDHNGNTVCDCGQSYADHLHCDYCGSTSFVHVDEALCIACLSELKAEVSA